MSQLADRLATVQAHLRDAGIDCWLLFDFRGTNPFAGLIVGLTPDALLTRRWWLAIPAEGEPSVTVHGIESGSFPDLGLPIASYSSRTDLVEALRTTLGSARRVAMEYSPNGNIPYVSTVDGGTIDLVRSLGVEVVSSADLLQLFLTWTDAQIADHRQASQALTETKDAALGLIRARLAADARLDEHELQTFMVGQLEQRGMALEHAPIVCFGPTSGDPHYSPSVVGSRPLAPGPVLMDLFCSVAGTGGGCADITWMAHVGAPGDDFGRAFETVVAARDEGVRLLRDRLGGGLPVRGFEVDGAVRSVLVDAGYERFLLHRTGHSLGTTHVHGDVANFDGIETLDERLVLPRLAFTIEPGVYTPEFGVRSELNVLTLEHGIEVTTAVQTELDVL